jgi:hypothetical protein
MHTLTTTTTTKTCTYTVINNDGSIVSRRDCFGMFESKVSTDGQKDHVAFACGVDAKEFHFDVSKFLRVNGRSGTSRATKDAQFGNGKVTLFQALLDFFANGTRGTDNGH